MRRLPLRMWPVVALLVGLVSGCAHQPRFDPARRPTVLVLSVGGPDGVAHLGAISAVKQARIPVAAVVGNSMGALVGALYASRPHEDTRGRLENVLAGYQRGSWGDRFRNGVALGAIFAVVTAVATEGDWGPVLGAAAGGLALGAAATPDPRRHRLVEALRATFGGARVESTPIPFVTFFHRPRGGGVELVTVRSGDLAEAVGSSLANPLVFRDVKVSEGQPLDPGADRVSATPIEDACRLFPQANILAINVSGQPAFYSAEMRCPLREVRLPRTGLTPQDLLRPGARVDQAIAGAAAATRQALSGS